MFVHPLVYLISEATAHKCHVEGSPIICKLDDNIYTSRIGIRTNIHNPYCASDTVTLQHQWKRMYNLMQSSQSSNCVAHHYLLEKLTGSQPVKKFLAFYGTRKFITAFTSARHLSLSWARSIQSMPPHLNSWRSILILSSNLCLGLPSGLYLSGLPTKPLY